MCSSDLSKVETSIELLDMNDCVIKSLSVVGGVSNNKYIKKNLERFLINNKIK